MKRTTNMVVHVPANMLMVAVLAYPVAVSAQATSGAVPAQAAAAPKPGAVAAPKAAVAPKREAVAPAAPSPQAVAPAARAPTSAPATAASPAANAPSAQAAAVPVQPATTAPPPQSTSVQPVGEGTPASAPTGPSTPELGDGHTAPSVGAGAQRVYMVPRVVGIQSQAPEAPEPARPPKLRYPLGLEFVVMPVWQTSRGFDLFSDEDIATRIGLGADVELGEIAARTPLSIVVGWTTDSKREQLLAGLLAPEYRAHNLHGGFKLQHRVLPFFSPHVHLAAGGSALQAEYVVAASQRRFESDRWMAFGLVGAGVTVALPTRIAVQPALVVEGGYLFSGSLPLRLEPTPAEGALPTAGANLGVLERSGPYLRFGAQVRY